MEAGFSILTPVATKLRALQGTPSVAEIEANLLPEIEKIERAVLRELEPVLQAIGIRQEQLSLNVDEEYVTLHGITAKQKEQLAAALARQGIDLKELL